MEEVKNHHNTHLQKDGVALAVLAREIMQQNHHQAHISPEVLVGSNTKLESLDQTHIFTSQHLSANNSTSEDDVDVVGLL